MKSFSSWIFILISLVCNHAVAQGYAVALISDSLKENSHCVIRNYTRDLELRTINSGIERTTKVITVLDKNGDNSANLSVFYDKDAKVTISEIILYNKNGQKIFKVKASEIADIPAYDGATLFADNRVKLYQPQYGDYPYTISFKYEVEYKNMISYGNWYPLSRYNTSLQHAEFSISYPDDLHFNQKEINITSKPTKSAKDSGNTETWVFENMKAIDDEPLNSSLSELVPKIYLMPTQLIYDNNKGSANNWQEYGKWVNDLYTGRDEISEKERTVITGLLKGVQDTIQKIKVLYRYMQGRTRYVGIQLGIGGYQPFPAQTVYETGYGDCKALSNYMHALLKVSGINSYPALVSSGRYIEPIYTDFPNFQQFDHVILCVPAAKDTIWLECTSQRAPFGFLGHFADDRRVLLITDKGGIWAHTRKYRAEENVRSNLAEFTINAEGTAECKMRTIYSGLQYDDLAELLALNFDEQKKWLYKNSSLPSVQLNEFTVKEDKQPVPSATINQSLTSRNYFSSAGNYRIIPLNVVNIQKPIPKMLKARRSEIIVNRSTIDYDTLIYHIPAIYQIESVPEGKTISTSFGDYSYRIEAKDHDIIYTRKFHIYQGRFKAEEYSGFYNFVLSVSKADNIKLMMTVN